MYLNLQKIDFEDFGDEIVMLELESGGYWSIKGGLIGIFRCLYEGASIDHFQSLQKDFEQPLQDSCTNCFALMEQRGLMTASAPAAKDVIYESTLGPPSFSLHEELSELVKLDPIHDVSDQGWPNTKSAT